MSTVLHPGTSRPAPATNPADDSELPLRAVLWADTAEIFDQILAHPFIAGLGDGSLDPVRFGSYLAQDSLYLGKYAQALAALAGRAPDSEGIRIFASGAVGALAEESGLHQELLDQLLPRLGDARPGDLPASPTTVAYTDFLLKSAGSGSFAEALGAVLPCYWIYAEVGAAMQRASSPDPLFARWIDTYAAPEFAGLVEQVLGYADTWARDAGERERLALRKAYFRGAQFEWMFWDAAWRLERWPVGAEGIIARSTASVAE
ncbi:TenA family protein [Saxibacter everestensis]|uniref:TenA family protein n=1 Tax=Saxibacter everestensis TaxID=2909229 RepID=A0ABY8QN80_9MICO|nr:TenA family protein [Brevibacteriaceae bacterium ZFBP1038]